MHHYFAALWLHAFNNEGGSKVAGQADACKGWKFVCAHSVHIAGGVMEGKLHTGALIINSRAVPENSAPAANVGNKTICAPSLPAPDAPAASINMCVQG
jgi:hypothetical protein